VFSRTVRLLDSSHSTGSADHEGAADYVPVVFVRAFFLVRDRRNARAVMLCFEGKISPLFPGSILRRDPNTTVYLDEYSAALLSAELRSMPSAPLEREESRQ